jgi:flagellin
LSVLDGAASVLASVNYTAGDNLNTKLGELQTAVDNANVGVTIDYTTAGGDASMGLTSNDYGSYADAYDLQISDATDTFTTTNGTATNATTKTMSGTLVDNAGAMSQVSNRGNTFQNAAGTVSITLTDAGMSTPIATANAVQAATGAVFQIGPNQNQTANVSIDDMGTTSIGRVSGYTLSELLTGGTRTVTAGQAQNALAIVDQAINDVSSLRGNLGAFQANTLESTASNLRATLENTVAAESVIRDTDFASEVSSFTKNQILQQAGISVLSSANQLPQLALSLLT